MENPDLKIFISQHKTCAVPECGILFPVQAGTAVKRPQFDCALHDNDGENISAQNPYYCELTVMYWAWKNVSADYYGFFHYRRYLSLDGKKHKLPYKFSRRADKRFINKARLERAAQYVRDYDLILPYFENMYMSAEEYYARSAGHDVNDLKSVLKIINEDYPDYAADAEAYLSSEKQLFSNIFIMKKDLFFEYCEWLFAILFKFDAAEENRALRTDGYLAERLLGIWYYHLSRTREMKTAFAQRVDILNFFERPFMKKAVYYFLPPGTKRRAFVKRLLGGKRQRKVQPR